MRILRRYLTALWLVFSSCLVAQDSLEYFKASLTEASDKATSIELIEKISKHYMSNTNRDSLKKYSNILLDLTSDTPLDKIHLKAKSYNLIANYNIPYNEYKVLAQDLINVYEKASNTEGWLDEQFHLALKGHVAGELESIVQYKKGLNKLDKLGDKLSASQYCLWRCKYLSNIASNYEYIGQYAKAVNIISSTINEAEKCQDSISMLYAYRTAGAIVGSISENLDYEFEEWHLIKDRLKEFLQKANELATKLNEDKIRMLTSYNLAYYYFDIDSLEKSNTYLDTSLSSPSIKWMPMQLYYTYMLKSDIAHKRGQKEISYKYLLEGNRNAEELNDERHSFLSKLDMANWHIKYDDFQSATHYISLIDTTLLANPELRRKYLSTLSTISEGKELYKDALIQYKAQYEIQDSLEKAGLSDQLAQLLEQYKNIEREKEIVNLKAENLESKLKFRSYLFGFGILCSALLMLSLWLFYFNRQKYLQQNSKRIEIEQRLLRSQMNPHFIFNSLNSIQGFFVNNGVKEGSEYLGKFSNLMRRILNQTSLEHHPLQTEIETLDIYLSIEKSRMEGKMTYNIDVSPEIETEFIQIPPLLLQPIVENAIWHGIAPKDGNGHIEIIIREDQKESQLIINIEDNGVGLNHSSNNHKPRGMKITQDRLGKNGKFKIVNNDKNQGVTVEIKINLND